MRGAGDAVGARFSGAGDVVGVWLLVLVLLMRLVWHWCGVAGVAGLIGARFLLLVMWLAPSLPENS